MASRAISYSEAGKPLSSEDDSTTLPYLVTHHKFPGRTNRLRALSQFRYIRVLNSSMRLSPRRQKHVAIQEFKQAMLEPTSSTVDARKKVGNLHPPRYVFHNNTLRKGVPGDDSEVEETAGNATEEEIPNSPAMAAWRGRATPILARKFFLPKYKIKW